MKKRERERCVVLQELQNVKCDTGTAKAFVETWKERRLKSNNRLILLNLNLKVY